MQRLRSTFTRSRTPTGAEMKSQSSLEVPKQVRSASFDEIQLEAQRQESAEQLKSIANIAMATSSSLSAAAGPATTSPTSCTTTYSYSVPPGYSGPSTGAVRKSVATLRIPQLGQTGQRSKSFDVAQTSAERGQASLLDRSSSSASAYGYVSRWRSSAERENPPAQAYSCWHCACVDEYRAGLGAASQGSNDSWEEDDELDDEQEADDEADSAADLQQTPVQLDSTDNSYYFVVLQQKSCDDSHSSGAATAATTTAGDEDASSDCSRREGSPEIRVTLTPSPDLRSSTDAETDELASDARILLPQSRQRRRSITRQEALTAFPLELPICLQLGDDRSGGQSSPDDDDDDDEEPRPAAAAANLVVRDIFLTVPELKRDRAASVDSCFNQNKNGKIETCYSLQVPQQSPRSKSVDIVLPTDVQTRYTALLPGNDDSRAFTGDKEDGGSGPGQREPRSTPDWSDAALNGEHLWVPTAASGEFCYANDCSKHGPRLKCSACRVVAHSVCTPGLNFACKPSFRDVGVRQYREQKITNHHWVHRRSQKGKCTNCGKSFQSKLSFSSKEIIAVNCSWCKQAYHNRESCFNAQRIGEPCELGLHSSIIVPPSWIVKLPRRGNFKSSLRKSPKKKRSQPKKSEEKSEDPGKLWAVKPIPTNDVTPVLVFINPKSGGNQGAKLLQKFQWLLNPRQVFDLTQGGPKMGLELFKKVPNLRILACGGDGTVGWVLSVLDQIGANPAPAVGTLPLGTGNDLARALGWGGGYTDEPIGKILTSMAESEISILDRWQLVVERNPDASAGNDEDAAKGKENLPLNVVNNYFSLGVDAHIALEFHEAREAHPERFNSRLRNKMFYGQMGGKDLVVRRWKDLSEFVSLECDGQDMTPKLKEHRVHAILFLNIASYGGGTHPWGGGIGREPTTEDGLIEVVGLTTYQLPFLQAGGHGTSIAQCSTAKIITTKTIPMQVDGEACRLLPSIINLSLLNKATMLSKRRNTGGGRRPKAAEIERLKIPLMRIRMVDYERFHSDKEQLTKVAQAWNAEPLDLDAAMDLESLRNMLAKEYPMDSCCFLDSCTAERFFRIDRAQEQLHYVTDVVSEAIYVLQEGPASSQGSQQQQQHSDNQSAAREDRRKASAEKKARTESSSSSRPQLQQEEDQHQRSQHRGESSRSRQPASVSRNSLAPADSERRRSPSGDNYVNNEDRQASSSSSSGKRQGSSKSIASAGSRGATSAGQRLMQHEQPPAFISPRDRLFGLSSEVHAFSTELLEKTSDGILRAAKVGDLPALKELHERGYSLLSIDSTGQTALHLASRLGYRDIVRYLIACAPPTILNMIDNEKGQTALHKAAQQKRRSICCMLVAGGAKLTVRDRNGNTPRELALIAEDRELAAYLHSQEQFQLVTEDMDNMS